MNSMFSGATNFNQNLGPWYAVLSNTNVQHGSNTIGNIAAQNTVLDGHNPTYTLVSGTGDTNNGSFEISGDTLSIKSGHQNRTEYSIRIGVTGNNQMFGANNAAIVTLTKIGSGFDENAFATTWKTKTANETISFYGGGTYTVNWGDGVLTSETSSRVTHTYPAAGSYNVSISGDLTIIVLGSDSANAQKLTNILQWGNASWTSMRSSFKGAINMTYNATGHARPVRRDRHGIDVRRRHQVQRQHIRVGCLHGD